MSVGFYADDGSWNITLVAGSTLVGRYAADGSQNAVAASGASWVGLHHPSGALNVTLENTGVVGFYAPDGSMYVTNNGANNGATKITVVSGSFVDLTGTPMGLLLAITVVP
jgi:hypothetical protein